MPKAWHELLYGAQRSPAPTPTTPTHMHARTRSHILHTRTPCVHRAGGVYAWSQAQPGAFTRLITPQQGLQGPCESLAWDRSSGLAAVSFRSSPVHGGAPCHHLYRLQRADEAAQGEGGAARQAGREQGHQVSAPSREGVVWACCFRARMRCTQ